MTTSISVGHPEPLDVQVRRVAMHQPVQWLERGWDDLRQIGWAGLAHGALIAILGGVLLMLGSTHLSVFVVVILTLLVGAAIGLANVFVVVVLVVSAPLRHERSPSRATGRRSRSGSFQTLFIFLSSHSS